MATAFSNLHTLFLLLLFILSILINAQTNNRISLGSSLLASDDPFSWLSPNGDFAFGFRRLDNQDNFLLAIWFEKIPEKTIVWYANEDNPAPKGSIIELSSEGQFTLNGPQSQVIWKLESIANGDAYASLLDTSNFVIANGNSSFLWESFDHPMDTILPTQVMEVGEVLSSHQTKSTYSTGRFQLRILERGDLVLNTIRLPTNSPYDSYYSSETSDELNRMNSGYKLNFDESGYLGIVRRNGTIFNLTVGNTPSTRDFYHRATLDVDGIFTQYTHPKFSRNGSWNESWSIVWYEPKDICNDVTGDMGSGACGSNTICKRDSFGRPICECLPGFSLVDLNNQYGGCKQDKVHSCEPGGSRPEELYEMHTVSNLFFPTSANYEEFRLSTEDNCSRSCYEDCNCVVVIIKDGYCRKKKMTVTKGRVQPDIYGKALIKIPKNDGSSGDQPYQNPDARKKDQATLVLVVSILLGCSLFLNFIFTTAISILGFRSYQKKHKLGPSSSLLETNLRSFTYEYLEKATNGFREKLGRGAFGTVYKGVLPLSSSNTTVAVKKLEKLSQEGEKEFKTEASVIATTHHKNLVRLLGFCDEGPQRLLVYEYMSNGTLASYVFGISRPDWNKRIQMVFGIARGLMYLHKECSTQIIHCDTKPQNILLDDSFTARISDFRLAKLLMSDQTRTTTAIRGTKGYVAPEWFRNKPVTAKVDVYSYGVMLLEIICCRKNVDMQMENEEETILKDWVYDCYKDRKLEKIVENDEKARNGMRRVERLVMVAIWCIQEDPSLRPPMKMVLQMLEGVVEVSVPPCPFSFTSIC